MLPGEVRSGSGNGSSGADCGGPDVLDSYFVTGTELKRKPIPIREYALLFDDRLMVQLVQHAAENDTQNALQQRG